VRQGAAQSAKAPAVLDRDCMETSAMETDRDLMVESKEVKKDGKEKKKDKKKEEERNDNLFARVKERLSMKSKKKNIEVKCTEANNMKENEVLTKKIDDQSDKQHSDIINAKTLEKEETIMVEKKKKENILERLLKRFAFGSKKQKENSAATRDTEVENTKEEIESNKDMKLQDDIKHCSTTSLDEDLEISALCRDGNDEPETSPSTPVMSSSRPPLPSTRKPPSSASTAHTKPVSQLDAALKQFKLSTAASRENLRSSRVDISQVEHQVKTMVTSRPATPTKAGWRSRPPPENTNLADQWKKLSASMTDLR
jgi:hypothetical protein